MAMNLHWRDVIHFFEAPGADVGQASKDKLEVVLNGAERFFRGHHHSKTVTNRAEVVALRHFLEEAGCNPWRLSQNPSVWASAQASAAALEF